MPDARGHLLFVPSAHGYELVERESEPPAVGDELELDGRRYAVAKLGPSPFPDDDRRCAHLQTPP